MTETRVFRRRVYHIGGYDHARPEVVHGRFARELQRFEHAWAASANVSGLVVGSDIATWQVRASGPNWDAETEIHLVRWDDVITSACQMPMWRRLPAGILAFLDFMAAGALWGYLKASWRYAIFFLYPFLVFAIIGLAAVAGGVRLAHATGSTAAGLLAGTCIVFGSFYMAERWLYLGLLFDDWIFSRRYIRYGAQVLDDRLQRLAADIAEARRKGAADEILIIGHSLGAVLAVDLIDRAINSGTQQHGSNAGIAFLSVGASILKIGLHRGATRFRAAVGRVSSDRAVFWADYSARSDVMNFCGVDPLAQMGLPVTGSPIIRKVSIRQMIEPARYPRIRRNWYRMHCQFVRGNDRRAPYDYFMSACGPVSAEQLAGSKRGAMDLFDVEGRLIDFASPFQNGKTSQLAAKQ